MEQLEKLKEFRELGLGEKVLKVLSKKGYESPTPIQRLTIPALLKNDKDIIGQAQTGTGKTAAFSLPIIENFENLEHIQAIVLTPTRELALQVAEEMNSLSTSKKMKVIPVYGGQSIDIQRKLIKTGVDVVVGTPGRVIDLIERKLLKLNSLKYFYENTPEYHITCAGSLLGIALAKPSSFPVGKVDFLNIYPMSFSEFLLANGDENLKLFLDSLNNIENIPDAFFNPLYEKLKMYYVTGGMPEAVYIWTQERDIELVRKTLNNILEAYERDFAKHPNIYEFPKISMIWKSIPSQLSKENKKFIYKVVKEGARAREYEDALQWLVNANLVTKVFKCSAPRMPLSSYDDISAFKIYLVDVGLLTRLSQLSPNTFGEGNRLFTEFKGALTENYILQGLISQFEVTPRYWAENNYEVDFIIQNENNIIPIEVKAETNIKSKSLQKFKEKFTNDIKLRVRFSFENLKLDDDLLNIPLFMVDYTEKIINIALNKMKEKNYG